MTFIDAFAGLLTLILLVYLFFALLNPERFG